MGLFQHKNKVQVDESSDGVQQFFDEYFMELRNRGRIYFENVVDEHAAVFKKDLDGTIARVDTELKEYITQQIEEQLAAYGKAMKDAQDQAIQALGKSLDGLADQQQAVSDNLQKNVAVQQEALDKAFAEHKTQLEEMNKVQAQAVQTLSESVAAVEKERQDLSDLLQKNIVKQQELLIEAFESNMARIVEHYLLGALGDQYDLKAQLPAIIKQMEANKEAIVEDMKL